MAAATDSGAQRGSGQTVSVGHNLGQRDVVVPVGGPAPELAPIRQVVRDLPDGIGQGPVTVHHGLGTRAVFVQVCTRDGREVWPPPGMLVGREQVELWAGQDLSGGKVVIVAQ